MSEGTELGSALAAQGGAAPVDVEAIVKREGRRVGIWAGVNVVLWLLAAGCCLASAMFYLVFLHPKLTEMLSHPGEVDQETASLVMRVTAQYLLYSNIIWPSLLLVAAMSTTLLVLRTRRATLRHVAGSLAQIQRQVDRLASREA